MYQRLTEIVFTDSPKKSRLTVTPHRVTVKVSLADREISAFLFTVGQNVARNVDSETTMRGQFDLLTNTVTLQTERRHPSTFVKITYNFEGEEIRGEARHY